MVHQDSIKREDSALLLDQIVNLINELNVKQTKSKEEFSIDSFVEEFDIRAASLAQARGLPTGQGSKYSRFRDYFIEKTYKINAKERHEFMKVFSDSLRPNYFKELPKSQNDGLVRAGLFGLYSGAVLSLAPVFGIAAIAQLTPYFHDVQVKLPFFMATMLLTTALSMYIVHSRNRSMLDHPDYNHVKIFNDRVFEMRDKYIGIFSNAN